MWSLPIVFEQVCGSSQPAIVLLIVSSAKIKDVTLAAHTIGECELASVPSNCDHCSMIALESVVDAIVLPATPAGWFEYRYSALSDGRLILVRARKDINAELRRWSGAMNDDLLVSIFDGDTETDTVTMPSGAHPVVDRMSDGRWIVADAGASGNERNGRIYAADGRKECEICLGDGIENLLCSPDGTIWVGYFDEGIFKGANKDGRWPVSTGGIVQFDVTGTPLWSFNNQRRDSYWVSDSYAMTLSGAELWACFYDEFPIARICNDQLKFWPNSVNGASAMAVGDNMVALGGGYNTDANCITIVKLEAKSSHKFGALRFTLGDESRPRLLQGRGDTLHIVSNGLWYKIAVDQAASAVTAPGQS